MNKMNLLLFLWTLHTSLVAAQECEERDIRITNKTATTTNGNTYSIAGGLQIICWESVGYCLTVSVE